MLWPTGLEPDGFLTRYWQKNPRWLPQALPGGLPSLTGAELAWLATQDDVESRLVFTDRGSNSTTYRLEHGPFDEQQLASLPARDWTLLVQDVEKHLPEFRAWLDPFDFLPEWRIDDLMISFAAPGGSVGPHVDHYDVFLCQMDGVREWRLASAGHRLAACDSGGLALLEPFEDPVPQRTTPGDVLYLPPGVPHWGIAQSACMTLSVGMRAPGAAELRATFDREFPAAENPFMDDPLLFYTDADLQACEVATGCLSMPALERCRRLLADGRDTVTDRELAITLGCTATDLKAWLVPESADTDELDGLLRRDAGAAGVHGWARLACWRGPEELLLFANGYWRSLPSSLADAVARLCRNRRLDRSLLASQNDSTLLSWLARHGALDLECLTE